MAALPFKFDPQIIDRLARYRREVIWVVAGVSALALLLSMGLLVTGAFATGVLAALLSAVSAALGGIAWRGLGLAEEVAENTARLEELRPRVDVLEATVELHSAQAGLSATLVDDLAGLVHDRLPERRYPRLAFPGVRSARMEPHRSEDETDPGTRGPTAPARVPSAATIAPAFDDADATEDDVDDVVDPVLLREIFAACIRVGDFETALARGEEIVAAAPNSRMAADFLALRPYLEHRAARPAPVKKAL